MRTTLAVLAALSIAAAILLSGAADSLRNDTEGIGDERLSRDDAVVALGRSLFFDTILSDDGTLSCSSCHDPWNAFADQTRVAVGIDGRRGRRNSPTILNRAGAPSHFWDGRAATLEEQALLPITEHAEFGTTVEAVLERVGRHDEYAKRFAEAFDDGVTAANLARAIAAFERTLDAGDAPADRFMRGEFSALSEEARKGKWIFESSGRCWRCHTGGNFTDELFHNTGVRWNRRPLDLGRFEVTGLDSDRGAFKTPTLRNVALTAPYMHDGSIRTLREVVEFYARGGEANPYLDPLMEPLNLSEAEIAALVAFLESLTSDTLPEIIPGQPARAPDPGGS